VPKVLSAGSQNSFGESFEPTEPSESLRDQDLKPVRTGITNPNQQQNPDQHQAGKRPKKQWEEIFPAN